MAADQCLRNHLQCGSSGVLAELTVFSLQAAAFENGLGMFSWKLDTHTKKPTQNQQLQGCRGCAYGRVVRDFREEVAYSNSSWVYETDVSNDFI